MQRLHSLLGSLYKTLASPFWFIYSSAGYSNCYRYRIRILLILAFSVCRSSTEELKPHWRNAWLNKRIMHVIKRLRESIHNSRRKISVIVYKSIVRLPTSCQQKNSAQRENIFVYLIVTSCSLCFYRIYNMYRSILDDVYECHIWKYRISN